mmetsp:Transcript_78714/g.141991  ORF Transcript_78714/g.141991 Transcript_78714/m.141991 type:complete len:316 (+) Transcript_78714:1273-2220(+)
MPSQRQASRGKDRLRDRYHLEVDLGPHLLTQIQQNTAERALALDWRAGGSGDSACHLPVWQSLPLPHCKAGRANVAEGARIDQQVHQRSARRGHHIHLIWALRPLGFSGPLPWLFLWALGPLEVQGSSRPIRWLVLLFTGIDQIWHLVVVALAVLFQPEQQTQRLRLSLWVVEGLLVQGQNHAAVGCPVACAVAAVAQALKRLVWICPRSRFGLGPCPLVLVLRRWRSVPGLRLRLCLSLHRWSPRRLQRRSRRGPSRFELLVLAVVPLALALVQGVHLHGVWVEQWYPRSIVDRLLLKITLNGLLQNGIAVCHP